MQVPHSIDTSHCPLCGQPNQCAISAGLPPESCWCMQTPVSKKALERLPAEERGKRCICPVCAQPAPLIDPLTDSRA